MWGNMSSLFLTRCQYDLSPSNKSRDGIDYFVVVTSYTKILICSSRSYKRRLIYGKVLLISCLQHTTREILKLKSGISLTILLPMVKRNGIRT